MYEAETGYKSEDCSRGPYDCQRTGSEADDEPEESSNHDGAEVELYKSFFSQVGQ